MRIAADALDRATAAGHAWVTGHRNARPAFCTICGGQIERRAGRRLKYDGHDLGYVHASEAKALPSALDAAAVRHRLLASHGS